MATARMGSKGRVTIPASVRKALGLRAGDRITFVQTERGFEMIAATGSAAALKGLIRKPPRPVTIEEMNKAIANHAIRRDNQTKGISD